MFKRYSSNIRYEELRVNDEKKQGDVSLALGVKRNTYSKWENLINDMPLDKCNDLAKYYSVTVNYLLGLSTKRFILSIPLTMKQELLPDRLLKLRKNLHLSQTKLSDKLGFLQSTYSRYERGKVVPTTLKLLVIAQFYNVSFDYLIGRVDDIQID